jgi:hypothetical protein
MLGKILHAHHWYGAVSSRWRLSVTPASTPYLSTTLFYMVHTPGGGGIVPTLQKQVREVIVVRYLGRQPRTPLRYPSNSSLTPIPAAAGSHLSMSCVYLVSSPTTVFSCHTHTTRLFLATEHIHRHLVAANPPSLRLHACLVL